MTTTDVHRAATIREHSRQALRFFNLVTQEMALGDDYVTAFQEVKSTWPVETEWQPAF